MEVILGSLEELPNSNTVIEVSEELSLLQVSTSGELVEIKNQWVMHWEHADMQLEGGVLLRGYAQRLY